MDRSPHEPTPEGGTTPDPDRHFRTEGLLGALASRSARGGAAMLGSNGAQVVLGLAATAALARILTPRDFGLLAMIAVLVGFVRTMKDMGLSSATVYHDQLSHRQASGVFWVNARLSVVLATFMAVMAPVLVWFYGEPRLLLTTLALAPGVLAFSLSAIHLGLLRRQMRFRTVATINLVSSIVGIAVAITAALLGAGLWALVLQLLVSDVVRGAGYWLAAGWRPSAPRNSDDRREPGVRTVLKFGREAAGARVVGWFGRNVDFLLIGRFLGATPLGLYEKAFVWARLPYVQFTSPVMTVTQSSLSRLQGSPERYRAGARRLLSLVFAVVLPATAFLAVASRDVILIVLGDQWLDAVPLLRALAVGVFLGAAGTLMKWIYLSEGRTSRQLRWVVMTTPVTVIAVAIGVIWGVTGVAVAYAIALTVLSVPSVLYCTRGSALTSGDVWASQWRAAVASALAALATLAFLATVPVPDVSWLRLITSGPLFLAIAVAAYAATPGGRRALADLVSAVRTLRQSPTGSAPSEPPSEIE